MRDDDDAETDITIPDWLTLSGMPQGTAPAPPPIPKAKPRPRPRWHGRKASNILFMTRATKAMTQAELADKVGVPRRTITAIENLHKSPSVHLAIAIAEALEARVEDIFILHKPRG